MSRKGHGPRLVPRRLRCAIRWPHVARFRREIREQFPRARFLCQRPRDTFLHTLFKTLDVFNLRLRLVRPAARERVLAGMGMPLPALPKHEDYVISRWLTHQAPIQITVCPRPSSALSWAPLAAGMLH